MHEPSDGIAEEVERQLQLTLAAAAIAARRAIAARQHAIEQARRDSEQAARAAQARIDAERLLATERLRPVFEPGLVGDRPPAGDRRHVAGGQHLARPRPARRRDADDLRPRRATGSARRSSDRSGLDPTQIVTLAAVQELEHEHQADARRAADASRPSSRPTGKRLRAAGFDDPQRREQLRARLADAGVPEPAIEARTLADLGQAREAAEAARTPPTTSAEPRRGAGARSVRELTRRR